ncbi:glycogen debranching protein GlgX [Pseudenhygromyxa sp. WMMC2535]|uniref:glycogen debranching protein GlgX n=1 Tax=Pseudenhygromyxa sp. WMMC2535 TaxID=2712867 RepID=UPI0015581529|nr:glycogen debranching protein GlgX [Pseudenhygromyxa sp. WMMC2535]NVB36742.1 glycogen debranching protein GlgX [Pseudenhygromyxa sp. WMMC2535]
MHLEPGLPYPLGATLRDGGVNFAVASEHAMAVDLCIFAGESGEERRLRLPRQQDGIWHGFLPDAGAGLVYGYRAYGPYEPAHGHRFNPHKLLLDPYAREIVGSFEWRDEHYGYCVDQPEGERSFDTRDNAAQMLKARVAAPLSALDAPPPRVHVAPADTVIYELHVKGFTKLHPRVPEALRGTYAGLAHPAVIDYLRELGVTTLSLLPVHYHLSERHLHPLGLRNYWGYNTIGFFAPDPRFSSTPDDPTATRREFRDMVAALHRAGLEVVLDVVYNHTAEAGDDGPTLSFRGLDNALYYRMNWGQDRARVENWTGCGNTLDLRCPRVCQFVLDSLRCWVSEYGVDGFRFDLAPILGRTTAGFDPRSPFLVALGQDPLLARTKLIAEPWDVGPGGYQLGQFPGRFLEWNDRYRDGLRRFWLTRDVPRGEFARRLAGSADFFQRGHRQPSASINFITAHDGYTLADLVSYEQRHNAANGEDNRDGHHANFSTNCGAEGPSDDPGVLARRARLQRAMLASLLLSQGTPMLLAGDELGNGQGGNNNSYCQDNPTGWIDWLGADLELLEFVRGLLRGRRAHAALRHTGWLSEQWREDGGLPVEWLGNEGLPMRVENWNDPRVRFLSVRIGEPDEALLMLFNAERSAVDLDLPPGPWRILLHSATPDRRGPVDDRHLIVSPETVVVLARPRPKVS